MIEEQNTHHSRGEKEVMMSWAQNRGDLGQDYMRDGPGKGADWAENTGDTQEAESVLQKKELG